MYDYDVFAVITPYHCVNASRIIRNPCNAQWFEKAEEVALSSFRRKEATPAPEASDDEELLQERLVITFPRNDKDWKNGQTIQMGTDLGIADVFLGQPGTKGISGKHCSIEIRKSTLEIVLTDSSTWGTAVGLDGKGMNEPRKHTHWVLAPSPGHRNKHEVIVICLHGVKFKIDFPHHEAGFIQYLDRLRKLAAQIDTAGAAILDGLTLDSRTSTQAPSGVGTPGSVTRYSKDTKISEGNFGEIWSARKYDGKRIVVKIFKNLSSEQDPDGRTTWLKNAQREFRIMRDSPHPNVAEVFEFQMNPVPAMLMAYYPDGDVAKARRRHTLDVEQLTTAFGQTMDGARYLHLQGIVHRDIKQDNILIRRKPHLTFLLADFGLAAVCQTASALDTFCGSYVYVAPEVTLASGPGYTMKADVWSLAVQAFDWFYSLPLYPKAQRGRGYDEAWFEAWWEKLNIALADIDDDKMIPIISGMLDRDTARRLSMQDCLTACMKAGLFERRGADGLIVCKGSMTSSQNSTPRRGDIGILGISYEHSRQALCALSDTGVTTSADLAAEHDRHIARPSPTCEHPRNRSFKRRACVASIDVANKSPPSKKSSSAFETFRNPLADIVPSTGSASIRSSIAQQDQKELTQIDNPRLSWSLGTSELEHALICEFEGSAAQLATMSTHIVELGSLNRLDRSEISPENTATTTSSCPTQWLHSPVISLTDIIEKTDSAPVKDVIRRGSQFDPQQRDELCKSFEIIPWCNLVGEYQKEIEIDREARPRKPLPSPDLQPIATASTTSYSARASVNERGVWEEAEAKLEANASARRQSPRSPDDTFSHLALPSPIEWSQVTRVSTETGPKGDRCKGTAFADGQGPAVAMMPSLEMEDGYMRQLIDGCYVEIRCADNYFKVDGIWQLTNRSDFKQAWNLFTRLGHAQFDYTRGSKFAPKLVPYFHGLRLCQLFDLESKLEPLLLYGRQHASHPPPSAELAYLDEYFGNAYSLEQDRVIVRAKDGTVNVTKLLPRYHVIRFMQSCANKEGVVIKTGPRKYFGIYVSAEVALQMCRSYRGSDAEVVKILERLLQRQQRGTLGVDIDHVHLH